MADYIDAAPSGWQRNFPLTEVYRNCASVKESFDLPLSGKVHHWGQDFSFSAPVSVLAEAGRTDEYIILNIAVSTCVSTACSRCLELGEVAIYGKLRYLYLSRSDSDADEMLEKGCEGGVADEEIIVISLPDEVINLGELVWETLITALPSTVLCADDCQGLCTQCGANLNKVQCGCRKESGDPRFTALQGLLEEDKD